MADCATALSDERLAEIRARLHESPPVIAVAASIREKSPVASYLHLVRNDQLDLVNEVDRLKAELEALRSNIPNL
jgi:hypothetical protein